MDKSGMLVGGTIGAVIVAVIFAVILLTPTMKSEIIASDKPIPSAIGETTPAYSKNLSLIEIFEKSEPGVVRVNIQRTDQANGTSGVGSGFVFDKKGHIITNSHVVKDVKKVVVTFLDGRSYNAEIIGFDEFTDIGVVKVNADLSLLQPLALGDSSNLKVGEPIAAIGNLHHPLIGISGRDIDPDLAKVLDLKDAVGFLVITVVENSPAAKAGIHGSNETVKDRK